VQSYTIGEFKQKLPEILESVSRGESVILEKGQKRKKVALLSPFSDQNQKPRRLGPLAHRGKLSFKDWEIDSATLLEGK
jgi:antitoxin (DNA-binding transcriptional repressor) of toxin-antitoxin stability system